MTKIRSTDSSNIDDQRGQGGGRLGGLGSILGGGGLKAGGGLLGIIVLLAAVFLPKLLGGSATQSTANTPSSGGAAGATHNACSTDLEQIVCGATNDVQAFWAVELPRAFNVQYATAKTTFFSGSVNTGCGPASSETGPFYCPVDRLVYLDLVFMQQLEDQLVGTTSDLAEQYIIAHEYGHHVQNLLGTSDKVSQHEQQDQRNGHLYSEALELQADCYAGVWISDANRRGLLDSPQEITEAFDAANGVGDDYIQSRGGGQVNPDTFTHGTSAQRKKWLDTGFTTGDPTQCAGTFAEMGVSV
ncbi:MAG: neutral zinc metallopeptidase [Ilumatobacteraceae bacterium]